MSILVALFLAVAQDYPDHVGVVNDFAGEIDPGTKAKIETVIADVKAKMDVRLVVVTVTSLGGKSVEDYTIGLTKKWGVGQKGKNNGILFLHAPKERKVRIENGYGVESRLTDVESKMIIEDTIIPLMKKNRFAEAMLRGSEEILKVLSAPEKQPEKQSAPISQGATSQGAKGDGIGAGGVILIVGLLAVVGIIIFVAVMSSKVEQPSRMPTYPSTYTPPTPRPDPLAADPMQGLMTGAVLGTMLGSQIPQTPTPPPIPTVPFESSISAAYLEDQRRRNEEEERRRRKRRQEEEEEEESRRRSSSSSSYDSGSSSSSSSYDSGSSSSDSFSGGDSGGGGASGSY